MQSYWQALQTINNFGDPYTRALLNDERESWGIDAVRDLLDRLDNPHRAYHTVHVTGTKGKGSTAAFITQTLMAAGYKTGLYTSPHLQSWRERIQINREPIDEDEVVQIVEDILPHAEDVEGLTAFEITTALAFWHFQRAGCDAAVFEVGLGGELDATTVVEPVVSVLTSISLDHTQILGGTLTEIARDKAMIIKPETPAVSAPQPAEALTQIKERAEAVDSPLTVLGDVEIVEHTWEGSTFRLGDTSYRVGTPGVFQVENAALAVTALAQTDLDITTEHMREGLAKAHWPGRLEVVRREPFYVLDGAHNPYSIKRLVESLLALSDKEQFTFVFGCMLDRDIDGIMEHLLPVTERLILTQADDPRAATVEELAKRVSQTAGENPPDVIATASIEEAVAAAGDWACFTGSLAIVGAVRSILQETN